MRANRGIAALDGGDWSTSHRSALGCLVSTRPGGLDVLEKLITLAGYRTPDYPPRSLGTVLVRLSWVLL